MSNWITENTGKAIDWARGFVKQPNKWGYLNNPRFVDESLATPTHNPCGYWFDHPAITSVYAYWQQAVAVLKSKALVGVGVMDVDTSLIYRLLILDYSGNEIASQSFTESNAVSGVTGRSFMQEVAGVATLFYFNLSATGELWMYRLDENGGSSSKKISDDCDHLSTEAVFSDGTILAIAGHGGAIVQFRSTNWGVSWSETTLVSSSVNWTGFALSATGTGNIYLAYIIWSDSVLFRLLKSSNKGSSWSTGLGPAGTVNPFARFSLSSYGDHLCIFGENYKATSPWTHYMYLLVSNDAGATWSNGSISIPTETDGIRVGDVNFPNFPASVMYGSVVVALCSGLTTGSRYIIKSTDYGATWSVVVDVSASYSDNWGYSGLEKPIPYTITNDAEIFTLACCGMAYGSNLGYLLSLNSGTSWGFRKIPESNVTIIGAESNPSPIWTNPS